MDIFQNRPFKNRNAEDYELDEITNLFVNPLDIANNPYEYENSIIKGEMGSGKTMYLKANYAFYLYSMVPSVLEGKKLILPVLIRLSDFQHMMEPREIYNAIIIKIIEEMATVYTKLQNVEYMARIHCGLRKLPYQLFQKQNLINVTQELLKLNANEYTEKYLKKIGKTAGIEKDFIKFSAELEKENSIELKNKKNPGISDINSACERLFSGNDSKIILLIDEAGALDKSFFKGEKSQSFFEILMNQFRTAPYLRTKIAVYPNSYSDILAETRYGDFIMLSENIYNTQGYEKFRKKAIELINKYLTNASDNIMKMTEVFEFSDDYEAVGDGLEQLIYASYGNLRRLVYLLDLSMSEAYSANKGVGKVNINHVKLALKRASLGMEDLYTSLEKQFLDMITKACRTNKGTYMFKFPYKSPVLSKYLSKSEEQNILKIIQSSSRRKGIVYSFDYCYCVSHDIPTHYKKGTEAIDRDRSSQSGEWITRVANIDEDVLKNGYISDKMEGIIYIVKNDSAIINGNDGEEYYLTIDNVVDECKNTPLQAGKNVKFYSAKINSAKYAVLAEIQ